MPGRRRSLGLIPQALVEPMAQASKILLVGAVAAISAQLGPQALMQAPRRLAASLALGTAVVAVLALAASQVVSQI